MDKQKTRLLIVGAGQFAHVAKAVFYRFPDLKVVGVVDTQEAAAQMLVRRFRAAWYSSYQEALKSCDCDIVYINVPSHLHTQFTQMALRAGKAVFCEKPFATNLQDAQKIAAHIKRSDLPFDLDLPMRESTIYRKLKTLLDDDLFGRFKAIEVWHRATESFIRNEWYWDRKLSGGWFLTTAIHFIDLITYLFPDEKVNTVYAYEKKEEGRTQSMTVHFVFASNAEFVYHHDFQSTYALTDTQLKFEFAQGRVFIEGWVPDRMQIITDDRELKEKLSQYGYKLKKSAQMYTAYDYIFRTRDQEYANMVRSGFERVLAALNTGSDTTSPGQLLKTQALCEYAQRSADNHRIYSIPRWINKLK